MVGMATLAIEVSSTCMKVPAAMATAVTASATPVRGGGPSAWAAWDMVLSLIGRFG